MVSKGKTKIPPLEPRFFYRSNRLCCRLFVYVNRLAYLERDYLCGMSAYIAALN